MPLRSQLNPESANTVKRARSCTLAPVITEEVLLSVNTELQFYFFFLFKDGNLFNKGLFELQSA